jgi:VCBS repeat-containing protein
MLDSESGHEDSYLSLEAQADNTTGSISHVPVVTIPDAELLFHADFKRSGNDLTLTGADGKVLLVPDYFKSEILATLLSPEGAALRGDIVAALAGPLAPGQYAAATVTPSATPAIGRVVKLDGSATVIRNGVAVALNHGDPILKGDVVQTGADGTLALAFNDGSVFQITPDSRLVLSAFTYELNGSANVEQFDLVQGSFSFISGSIAKNGNMRIGTPVATMKIEGTAGGGDIASDNGQIKLYIFQQTDGEHKAYVLDQNGNVIATLSSVGGRFVLTPSGPSQFTTSEQNKTDAEKAAEQVALDAILQLKSQGSDLITDLQPKANGPHGSSFIPDQLTQQTGALEGTITPIMVVLPPIPNGDTGVGAGGNQGNISTPLINHDPVPQSDAYSVDEDGILVVVPTGVLANDFDADGDPLTATLDVGPLHGTLVLRPDGSFVYTPVANYNGTDTFTYRTSDGTATSAPITVNLNINPVNDAPVFAVNAAGGVAALEQTAIAVAPNATISDIDSTTLAKVTVQLTGNYQPGEDVLSFTDTALIHGVFNAATGALTLTAQAGQSPTLADFEAALHLVTYTDTVDAPVTLPRTITITVQDPDGTARGGNDTAVGTVNLTVTPVNDDPVITGATNPSDQTEAANASAQDIPAITGTLSVLDPDRGDTLTASVTGNAVATYNGSATLPGGVNVSALVASGAISFDTGLTDGIGGNTLTWTYDPTAANLDWLRAGDVLTITYTAKVNDGTVDSNTQLLTITINGTNDAPIITGESNPVAVVEAGNASVQDIAPITGTLTVTDLDIGDTLTGSVVSNATASYDGGALPPGVDVTSLLASGAILFSTTTTNGSTGNTLTWTYDPAAANLDWLRAGKTLTITYDAQVNDGSGNVGSQTLTIIITGTNDAPIITGESNPVAVVEATSASAQDIAPITGTLTVTDLDIGDTLTGSVAGNATVTYNGGALPGGVNITALLASGAISFDTVSTNGGTGNTLTWTYDPVAANLDWLRAGDTLTITYTARVNDGSGNVGSQPLTITINGTNDAPIITGVTNPANVIEAANASAQDIPAITGTLSVTDLDLSDTLTGSVTGVATPTLSSGSLPNGIDLSALFATNAISFNTVSSNAGTGNTLTWTYNPAAANLDWLQVNQTLTITYIAQVTDGAGNVGSQPLTIVIVGRNDTPIVTSADTTGSVTEDVSVSVPGGLLKVSGFINFTDVDVLDTHFGVLPTFVGSTYSGGQLGTMNRLLTSDTTDGVGGQLQWTFSVNNAAVQFLAFGQSISETYTVPVSDGKGGVVPTTIVVTIEGKNDAPVITSATLTGTINEDQAPAAGTGGNLLAFGSINFTDVDLADIHHGVVTFVSSSLGTSDGLGTMNKNIVADSTNGATGQLNWRYVVDPNAVQFLKEGQIVTETYTVAVSDGNSGVTPTTITITLTGTNDVPVITAHSDPVAAIVEDTDASAQDIGGVTGTLTVTDLDLGDTLTGSAIGNADIKYTANGSNTQVAVPNGFDVSALIASGAISFDSVSTNRGTGNVLHWTYNPAAANLDWLNVGDKLTITYNAQVNDGHGNVGSEPITITITGTNDNPVVTTSETFPGSFSATEDTAPGGAFADYAFSDRDFGDQTLIDAQALTNAGWAGTDIPGVGDFWIKSYDHGGTVYIFNYYLVPVGGGYQRNVAYIPGDELREGQVITADVVIPVIDSHGGHGSATVTFTITGTNDVPVITAHADPVVAVVEDTSAAAQDIGGVTGTLTVTDLDLGDTLTGSVIGDATALYDGGAVPAQYQANIAALLAQGAISFDSVSTNGSTGNTLTWTYNPAAANLDWLGAGKTLTITYQAQVDDGHGNVGSEPITITITGTNDAPVIAGHTDPASPVLESLNASAQDISGITGTLTVTDVDVGDSLTGSVTGNATATYDGGAVPAQYQANITALLASGAISFNTVTTDGGAKSLTWTYDPAAANLDWLVAGKSLTITYQAQVNDGHGNVGSEPITITITGTNDAPVMFLNTGGPVTALEQVATAIAPALTLTDVDSTTLLYAQAAKVSFTANYHTGEDVLSFTDTALIHGVFTASDGALRLTAQAGQSPTMADFEAALRSVTYTNTSDNPSSGARSIEFRVQDPDGFANGGQNLRFVTATLNVTPVNDAPVITGHADPASPVLESLNASAQDISGVTGTLAVTDADVGDSLTGSVTGNATALYDGGAVPAQYQANIAALLASGAISFNTVTTDGGAKSLTWTYDPAAANLDWLVAGKSLTITYQAQVNDGHGNVGSEPITITITGTNDAPVMFLNTGGPVTALEQVATAIAPALTLTDVDSTTLLYSQAAKVSFTANYHTGEDVLSFTDTALIHGVFTASDGALRLTAQAGQTPTLADFEAALRSVTYTNTSDNPSSGTRSIEFRVQDPDGFANGGQNIRFVTATLNVTSVNDVPVITAHVDPATVYETLNASAQDIGNVTGTLAVTDLDIGDSLTGSVTSNATAIYSGSSTPANFSTLVAALVDQGAITFNTVTTDGGSKTLTWTYDPAAANLDWLVAGQTLTITYQAQVNDGHGNVGSQPITITITGTNDAPVAFLNTGGAVTVLEQVATAITPALTLVDADSTTLLYAQAAKVQITANYHTGEDVLSFTDTALIHGVFTAADGALRLTAQAGQSPTMADFEAALRSVKYLNTSDNPSVDARTVEFSVQDPDGTANGGQSISHSIVTLNVTPVNDAPVITGHVNPVNGVFENLNASAQDIAGNTTATTGTLTVTDLDVGDTLTGSAIGNATASYSGGAIPNGVDISALIAQGAISFNTVTTDGGSKTLSWSYDPAAANLDWLAQLQTLTITYNVQVNDGHGNVGSEPISITITGTNDRPVATATVVSDAYEHGNPNGSIDLVLSDPDSGDTASVRVDILGNLGWTDVNGDGSLWNLSNAYGAARLHITPGSSTVNVEFIIATHTLRAGETATYDVVVPLTDVNSVSSKTVTFTLHGENDAPYITAHTNPAQAVAEDTNASAQDIGGVTGTLTVTDLDIGDTLTGSVIGDATALYDGGAVPVQYQANIAALLAQGAISFNTVTTDGGSKTLTWTYDPAAANLDWLAEGRSLTITYQAQVNDGQGNVGSEPITITITGTNDAPVISVDPAGFQGHYSLSEGGGSGNTPVSVYDADLGDTASFVALGGWDQPTFNSPLFYNGIYGTAKIQNGQLNYTAGSGAEQLKEGQTVTETVTIYAQDSHNAITSQNVIFTITGTNDAPVITGHADPVVAVVEDLNASAQDISGVTGTLTVTDVDIGDTLTGSVIGDATALYDGGAVPSQYQANIAALLGQGAISFDTVTTDGGSKTLTWTYDPAAANLDWLAEGKSLTITYQAQVNDGHGNIGSEPITITITGTNDAPSISTAQNIITASDPDFGDHAIVVGTSAWELGPNNVPFYQGDYGTAKLVTASGPGVPPGALSVAYTLQNTLAYAHLRAGQQAGDHVPVQATDNHGGIAAGFVLISGIVGAEDAPTLTAVSQPAAAYQELGDAHAQDLAAINGTLTVSDLDIGDTFTASVGSVDVSLNGNAFTLPPGAQALIANALSFQTGVLSNGGDQTINWTYDPAAADLDFVPAGQNLVLTFNVMVNDGILDTGTRPLTITITGTNDAPVLGAVDDYGSADTDRTAPIGPGNIQVFDADDGDTLTGHVVGLQIVGGSGLPAGAQALFASAMTFTSATSHSGNSTLQWTYTPPAVDLHYLSDHQIISLFYTIAVSDGLADSNVHTIEFDLVGTNDPTIITGQIDPATPIVELADASAQDIGGVTGTITVTDLDVGNVITGWAASDATATYSGGTIPNTVDLSALIAAGAISFDTVTTSVSGGSKTLTWTYDPAAANLDWLAAGETLTITYPVNVDDTGLHFLFQPGTTTISITITGTNDAPVATAVTATGNEDAASIAVTLTDTDPDVGDLAASFKVLTLPDHGTLYTDATLATVVTVNMVLSASGSKTLYFVPDAQFSGSVTFQYTATDSNNAVSGAATATIDVAPIADALNFTVVGGNGSANPTITLGSVVSIGDQSTYSNFGQDGAMATTALSGGRMLVVFDGKSPSDGSAHIYARVTDTAGNPLSSSVEIGASGTGLQATPSLTTLANGTVVMAWADWSQNTTYQQLYTVDASNNIAPVNTVTPVATGSEIAVAGLDNGGYWLAWAVSTSSTLRIQEFDASGNSIGSPHDVFTSSHSIVFPDLVTLNDGSLVLVWQNGFAGALGGSQTYKQHFDAAGNALGAAVVVDTGSFNPEVAALANGGYVVVSTTNAYIFDGNDNVVSTTFISGFVGDPRVQPLLDGTFVVLYNPGGSSINAQRYDALGHALGTTTQIATSAHIENVSLSADGKIVVLYMDSGSAATPYLKELTVPSLIIGNEDTTINLHPLSLVDADPSETVHLVISGFPAGAVFMLDGVQYGALATTGPDAGKWVIDVDSSHMTTLLTHPLQMTPPQDYNGSFNLNIMANSVDTATLSTGTVTSNGTPVTQTLYVSVSAVNDAPTAQNTSFQTSEDAAALTNLGPTILATAHDVDTGQTLVVSAVSNATGGTASLNAGNPSFTPTANFSGIAGFDYTISDGNGGTVTKHATVDVAPVADAPVFSFGFGTQNAIVNGGFESGLTGWGTTGSTTFSATNRTYEAVNYAGGTDNYYFQGPASGSAYALSDPNQQGVSVLQQFFTLPYNVTSVTISFDMFVLNRWATHNNSDGTLDTGSSGKQFGRVDLVNGGYGTYDTSASAVVSSLYLGTDYDTPVQPISGTYPAIGYIHYSFTATLTEGGTYGLRFADLTGQLMRLEMGVDNVAIAVTAGAGGLEDTDIVIGKVAPSDTDGSEHVTKLVLSGFAAGAIFKINGVQAGALDQAVGSSTFGKWVITDQAQLDSLKTTDLKMTPPHDYNGTFTLDSVATITDTATLTTGQTSVSQTFTNSVSVEVVAGDDAPVVIASAQDHDLVETGTNVAGVLTASRTLTLSDVDVGDISGTYALAANGWTDAGNGNWTLAATYGTVTLSTSTNKLTYTLDDNLANSLHAGQVVTDGIPVPTTDAGGAQGLTIVNFTIDGSNDAPALSAIVSPAVISGANSAGQDLVAVTGTMSVTDVDIGDTFTASVVGTPTATLGGQAFALPSNALALITNALTFQSGVISDGATKSIGWTYDPGAANLSFLDVGQSLVLTYIVKVNDGAADSGTQTLTFTITGGNHAPVVGSAVGFGVVSTDLVGTPGNGDVDINHPFSGPAVTPDGKWVVFDTRASTFAGDADGNNPDVYIKNTLTGELRLVSTDSNGNKLLQVGNLGQGMGVAGSFGATISDDGRYVAFTTSTKGTAADTNTGYDVYLKDLVTGTLTLVSHATAGAAAQGDFDTSFGISGNGQYVFFSSYRSGDVNLYRWDRTDGTIIQVSVGDHQDHFGGMTNVGISTDGNIVMYAGNQGLSFIVDLSDPQNIHDVSWPVPAGTDGILSANGQFAVYSYVGQIYLYEIATGNYELVSQNYLTGDTSNGGGYRASISSNGRYVAFVSSASDLVAGDNNGAEDVFVRDTVTNVTTRITVTSDGSAVPNLGRPSVDDNGHVYFAAGDNALVPTDTNNYVDVYSNNLHVPIGGTITENASQINSTGPNLLSDGGFEGQSSIPDFGVWGIAGANAVTLLQGHTGNAAASFNGGATSIYQSFNTVQGQTYRIDFFGQGLGNQVTVRTDAIAQLAVLNLDFTGTWTEYSYTFTASASATTLIFDVAASLPGQAFALDDVSVKLNVSTPHAGTEITSGSFSFTDADVADTHSVSVLANSNVGSFGVSLGADSNNGQTGGVDWTYSVADSAIEHLAAGQILSQQYVVRITDSGNPNAFVDQVVTVNTVGVNDAPVLDNSAGSILIATQQATAAIPELIQNGGFETGTLSNWTGSGAPITTLASNSGVDAVRANGTTNGTLSQTIATVSGQTYHLSFWVMATNGSGTAVSGGNFYSVTQGGQPLVAATHIGTGSVNGWILQDIDFVANSNSTTLQFTLRGGSASGRFMYLDDVSVKQVATTPAPSGAVGTLVSTLVGANNVSDVDDNAMAGIAVTSYSGAAGTWYYSTDNGANWWGFGGVDNSSALLLLADASTRIFFQADPGSAGSATIKFNAWDGSVGTNGGHADAGVTGGSAAFSTAETTAYVGIVSPSPYTLTTGADHVYYVNGTNTVSGVLGSTVNSSDSLHGAGNDTLNLTGNSSSADFTAMSEFTGFKNINLNGSNDRIVLPWSQDFVVTMGGTGNTVAAGGGEIHRLTIVGSAGADTLEVIDDSDVVDADLAHISGVETIKTTGNSGYLTLGANAGIMAGGGLLTIDGSGTSDGTIAYVTAMTTAFKFIGGSGNDGIWMTAAQFAAQPIITGAGDFGGLGDYIEIVGTGDVQDSAFTNVTGIENLFLENYSGTVTLGTRATSNITSAGFTVQVDSASGPVTIDLSALSATSTGRISVYGDVEDDIVKLTTTNFTSAFHFLGYGGNDAIQLTTAGTVADAAFTDVQDFDKLILADGNNTLTLASNFWTATETNGGGFIVDGSAATGANSLIVNATGLRGEVVTFIGGAGNDLFRFSTAQSGISSDITIDGKGGNDTVQFNDAAFQTLDESDFSNINHVETLQVISTGSSNITTISLGAAIDRNVGPGGTFTIDGSTSTGQLNINVNTATANLVVTGGTGIDHINTGSGNDVIRYIANGGADVINGGAGNNRLDILDSGGNDTVVIDVDAVNNNILGVNGGSLNSINTVTLDLGTGSSDTLSYANTAAIYSIVATIGGSATGFTGNILGVENLIGGAGNDTLTGDDNANILSGGLGVDVINGMGGDDTIRWALVDGADIIDGGSGINTLQIVGTGGNDIFTASFVNGVPVIANGPTTTNIQNYSLDLGAGNSDTLSYAGTATQVIVNLGTGTATGFSSIAGVENVTGGDGDDFFYGNGSNNAFDGGAGDDMFTYDIGGGADSFTGGTNTSTGDTLMIHGTSASDTVSVTVSGGQITAVAGITINGIENFLLSLENNTSGSGDTLSYANTLAAQSITVNLASDTATGFSSIFSSGGIGTVENVTGGAGSDTLTGDGNANTLTGGGGADSLSGGGGDDILVGDQSDTLLDGGTGTNTLQIGANFTAASDGQIVNVQNITLTGVTGIALTLSGQSEGFNITGTSGADTIIGTAQTDTITGGAGGDTLTGGLGADTFTIAGTDSTATITGSAISGYDVITDFSTTDDKLNLPGTPVAVANTAATNGTDSLLTVGGATLKSHSISNGIIRFDDANTFAAAVSLGSNSDVATAYQYLTRNDIGSAGSTVAFTATIGAVNHTFVYVQGGSTNSNGTNTFVDLQGVTIANLNTLIGTKIDPIVLDLGGQGIHFTSAQDGVHFDLDADGVHEQVAWTTGQEGILALDVNHNGTIDDGSEIFSPFFAGGSFADGLSALATLDSNGDGKIDGNDTAFKDLVVWQDTNHDGISDPGELSGLFDLGIGSISLDATAGDGDIDGQAIASNGTFTWTDGTSGHFVEVALETAPAPAAPAAPPAAPADSFDFTQLTASLVNNVQTIDHFQSGVDTIHIGHDLAGLTTGLAVAGTGDLAADLMAVLTNGNLIANGAAEVTVNGGANAGTYAVVNDGTAGFNVANDAVFKLANAALLHTSDFII